LGLALGSFALPAFAGVDLSAFVDGPKTLKAGLSGTYQVKLANFSQTDAPVELYVIFAGKLDQTDQIRPAPGYECGLSHDAGINASVRCTGKLPHDSSYTDIVLVQGRGQEPGVGKLLITVDPSHLLPDTRFENNTFQLDVTIN
jgi:hypothetical protein